VIVYNLKDKKIEKSVMLDIWRDITLCFHSLVPVLDEVRDITISRNGTCALVSSEGKVSLNGLTTYTFSIKTASRDLHNSSV
jgi:hypothetical protein